MKRLPLTGACEINPASQFRFAADEPCTFVPMELVDDLTARIIKTVTRPYREVRKGYTTFAEQDVLIAKITPCMENGKCAIARNLRNGVGFGSTEFHVLRASSLILPEWLFYFWRLPDTRKKAEKNMTGSAGQKRVPTSFLESMEIPVPSLSEQKRVTKLLEHADRLCHIRRYALALSQTFLPVAFLELFGDLRSNPHRFDIREFGEICDVRDGTHESPKFQSQGIPLVTSKNLVNGFVDLSEVDLISEEDFVKINKRSKVDRGDILMPMIGTIGNPVLVDQEPRYAVKNVALIKFIEGSPSALYIRELLRGTYFDLITSKINRGGTQKFIALGDIRGFPIPTPPLGLQSRFATLVQFYDKMRADQREALRQAEHLFQTLLHQAFL